MWWGLLLLMGMALVGPITETVEARWLSRKISEELGQMRMHMRSGHLWDATRGQWIAETACPAGAERASGGVSG